MPSIGWSEMLLLAVVAIVVVGPRELPRLMRVVGHWMGKARAAAREFQQAFDDLARDSEMEEMRRKVDKLRKGDIFPDFDEGHRQAAAYQNSGNGVQPATAAGEGEAGEGEAGEGETGEGKAAPGDERNAEDEKDRTVPSH